MKRMASLLTLACAACSSWTTAPPKAAVVDRSGALPAEVGRVCVARTSDLARAVAFPTWDNGTLVGATKGPTHFCYLAAPGPHRLTMKGDNDADASVVVESGHDYVLLQEVDYVFGIVNVRPTWVGPERAESVLAKSDYEVLDGVPGDQKLPDPVAIVPAR